jgi:agmatine/peptidylarginine deiminase
MSGCGSGEEKALCELDLRRSELLVGEKKGDWREDEKDFLIEGGAIQRGGHGVILERL